MITTPISLTRNTPKVPKEREGEFSNQQSSLFKVMLLICSKRKLTFAPLMQIFHRSRILPGLRFAARSRRNYIGRLSCQWFRWRQIAGKIGQGGRCLRGGGENVSHFVTGRSVDSPIFVITSHSIQGGNAQSEVSGLAQPCFAPSSLCVFPATNSLDRAISVYACSVPPCGVFLSHLISLFCRNAKHENQHTTRWRFLARYRSEAAPKPNQPCKFLSDIKPKINWILIFLAQPHAHDTHTHTPPHSLSIFLILLKHLIN